MFKNLAKTKGTVIKILSTVSYAVRNEIDIDKDAASRLALLGPGEILTLPRVLKYPRLNSLVCRLSRYLSIDCLLCLFFVITAPVIWAFMALVDLGKYLNKPSLRSCEREFYSSGDFAFQSHGKIFQCVSSIRHGAKGPIKRLGDDLTVLMKPRVYVLALILAVVWLLSPGNLRLVLNQGNNETYFFRLSQSYITYRLIVVIFLLEKFRRVRHEDSMVFICNHYDRWSVAIDRSGVNYSIVQHGNVVPIRLTYRLRSPSALFVTDDYSKEVFKGSILGDKCASEINICLYSVKLNFVPVTVPRHKVSVLYIGEAYNFNFEYEFLVGALDAIPECYFIYKKHPRASLPANMRSIKDDGFVIFDKEGRFPIVDCVISFNSTLGDEYDEEGYNVWRVSKDVSAKENLCLFKKHIELNFS